VQNADATIHSFTPIHTVMSIVNSSFLIDVPSWNASTPSIEPVDQSTRKKEEKITKNDDDDLNRLTSKVPSNKVFPHSKQHTLSQHFPLERLGESKRKRSTDGDAVVNLKSKKSKHLHQSIENDSLDATKSSIERSSKSKSEVKSTDVRLTDRSAHAIKKPEKQQQQQQRQQQSIQKPKPLNPSQDVSPNTTPITPTKAIGEGKQRPTSSKSTTKEPQHQKQQGQQGQQGQQRMKEHQQLQQPIQSSKLPKSPAKESQRQQQQITNKPQPIQSSSKPPKSPQQLQHQQHQHSKSIPLVKNEKKKTKEENDAAKDEDEETLASSDRASEGHYSNELEERMMSQLKGSQFRWINEKLYTTTGNDGYKLFQQQPELFNTVRNTNHHHKYDFIHPTLSLSLSHSFYSIMLAFKVKCLNGLRILSMN
jgi:hypothetical protein